MEQKNQEVKYVPVPTSAAGLLILGGLFVLVVYLSNRDVKSAADKLEIDEGGDD